MLNPLSSSSEDSSGAITRQALPNLCDNCGQAYRPGELICTHCGNRFSKNADTHQINVHDLLTEANIAPRGDAFATTPNQVTFEIEGQRLTLPDNENVVVGRFTETPGDIQPDIDLSAFDGAEKGVSRRHLRIRHKGYLTYVADLSSRNGTWLNGKRLIGSERLLRNGDELRLGRLKIKVRF